MKGRAKFKEFFDSWVIPRMIAYQEPERVGVPKGEPVGLFRKKFYAAQLQILYPAFSLIEIAVFAEVTPNQLRVWRTQEAFKQAAKEALDDFQDHAFRELIKCQNYEDYMRFWSNIMSFLSEETIIAGIHRMITKIMPSAKEALPPEYLSQFR
jgi:hypothetical protein